GRDASMRVRIYGWDYALRLAWDQPLLGHGQGGYLTLAQQMLPDDLERDPAALNPGLMGHAHNEWLEVLADLGIIGLSLQAAVLLCTFMAGWSALRGQADPWRQGALTALMASLVALTVE